MTALQCFEAAARHLSFTRAAEELHLTQSAVSKQVAQLEEMLCHNLFERVRQRLYLSPAGSLYLTEVHKILTQVDISSRYILTYGGETEVLRIATQPTFGDRWLVPKLKDFAALHPNIHLDVRNELEPFDVLQAKADMWRAAASKHCRAVIEGVKRFEIMQFIPNRKEPLPKGRLWQCGKAVDTARQHYKPARAVQRRIIRNDRERLAVIGHTGEHQAHARVTGTGPGGVA
jgi:hypothetical protein